MTTKASPDPSAFSLPDGQPIAAEVVEANHRCPGDGRARQHLAALLATHPEVLVEDLDLATACRAQGLGVNLDKLTLSSKSRPG